MKKYGKEAKIKIFLALAFFAFALLVLSGLSEAVFIACFNEGDKIDFCNPLTPDRTCSSSFGCSYCMSSYNATRSCFNQGSLNACNDLANQTCSDVGVWNPDISAPNTTIKNPSENAIYPMRIIGVDISVTEKSSLYYIDNLHSRGIWTKLCTGCFSYNGKRSFREGENDITFKSIDSAGNSLLINRIFFVDSKKPRISKIEPKRGFASGEFYIKFQELNPKSLVLTYGTYGNYKTALFDVNDPEVCEPVYPSMDKFECSKDIDLSEFDGSGISYWFTLTDIADNIIISKQAILSVDTTYPVLNNPEAFSQKIGNYLHINMDITERNFDSVKFIDNTLSRPVWRKLCSSLSEGKCIKKILLRGIPGEIDFQIIDDAGNSIGTRVSI